MERPEEDRRGVISYGIGRLLQAESATWSVHALRGVKLSSPSVDFFVGLWIPNLPGILFLVCPLMQHARYPAYHCFTLQYASSRCFAEDDKEAEA